MRVSIAFSSGLPIEQSCLPNIETGTTSTEAPPTDTQVRGDLEIRFHQRHCLHKLSSYAGGNKRVNNNDSLHSSPLLARGGLRKPNDGIYHIVPGGFALSSPINLLT